MIPPQLKELVDTEANYIHTLKYIIKGERIIEPHIIKKEYGKLIFEHLRCFNQIHSVLYDNLVIVRRGYLNASRGNPSSPSLQISSCFLNIKEDLLRYADYCKTLHIVQPLLDETISLTVDGAECKVKDLLSIPIQRVLKYQHLLEQLLNSNTLQNDTAQGIKRAHEMMQDLAQHINQVKRDIDIMQILDSIHNSISGLDDINLTDFGKLVYDGSIRVRLPTNQNWSGTKNKPTKHESKRYVFVFDKIILICKVSGLRSYQLKEYLPLSEYYMNTSSVLDGSTVAYSFSLISNDQKKTYSFYAKTPEAKSKWIDSIQRAMENIRPPKMNGHYFMMHTFESSTYCDHCNLLFAGLYYQGYKCRFCSAVAHKRCLGNIKSCKCSENVPQTDFGSYMNVVNLDEYPWYYGEMDRTFAQTLLKNLSHGAFLVRVSPTLTRKASITHDPFNQQLFTNKAAQKSYVISLNYNSQIKHMRVHVSENNELYLSQNRSFKSLIELVCWYEKHSLVESFHLLDAKLEIPFKFSPHYRDQAEHNESGYEYVDELRV